MKAFQRLSVVVIAIAIVLAAAVPGAVAQSKSAPAVDNTTLVLTGAKIYPSPDATAISDGVVVIRNGKIVAAGKRAEFLSGRTMPPPQPIPPESSGLRTARPPSPSRA